MRLPEKTTHNLHGKFSVMVVENNCTLNKQAHIRHWVSIMGTEGIQYYMHPKYENAVNVTKQLSYV